MKLKFVRKFLTDANRTLDFVIDNPIDNKFTRYLWLHTTEDVNDHYYCPIGKSAFAKGTLAGIQVDVEIRTRKDVENER